MDSQDCQLAWSWASATFGAGSARSRRERALRLLEESMELAQTLGVTYEEAQALGVQVFSKPRGDLRQEAGGVMVTLACLLHLLGFDPKTTFAMEFSRCLHRGEEIKKKQLTKVRADVPQGNLHPEGLPRPLVGHKVEDQHAPHPRQQGEPYD